jgi:2-polyprenyl-6-methoxyphenol hydroxylase-like FAD-dependent oxidoreductase
MTPNIGFGGNCGIESAAALANAIHSIVDSSHGQRPSNALVEERLQAYQRKREKRANGAVVSAGEVTRMQAGKLWHHRVAARLVRILPGDFIADFLSEYFSDAEMLVGQCY